MPIPFRLLLAACLTALPTAILAAPIEYRDWSLGQLGLIVQSIVIDEAKMYDIGPSSTPGIRQVAMLISEDPEVEDSGAKNVVLIECGMHGREWYATESCHWWIDHLLQNRRDPIVRELLSQVDIWVIPLTNPAGRNLDDLNYGDPTQFAYVCDSGAQEGDACEDDGDCPGGSCYKSGWRSNANTSSCPLGVDPARNFSSDWAYAPDQCAKMLCRGGADHNDPCSSDTDCSGGRCKSARMQWRGHQPFSEPETRNLRRFVHNHMISMTAIVHANSQQIWNQWYGRNDATSYMTSQLVAINAAASALHPPDPTMALDGVGGGSGQFSAWLAEDSDVVGELDFGSARNISTFYFEIPILYTDYAVPYQDVPGDGSNSFHPSGLEMVSLWGEVGSITPDADAAIRPLLSYVARQARSPQCPVDDSGSRLLAECDNNDFGIVGAKIASAIDEPGLLDYADTTREETLGAGTHQIVFAVQSFSAIAASSSTNATVEVSSGATPTVTTVPISLVPGRRDVYSVPHTFAFGGAYEVRIQLDADDFRLNNTKVFKFRVPGALLRPIQRIFGIARLFAPGSTGRLIYRGAFPLSLAEAPQPQKGGLEIRVFGHAPAPSSPPPQQEQEQQNEEQQGPVTLAYQIPGGSPWWDGSRPEKGRWIYKDPKGLAGPVRQLWIHQKCRGKKATTPLVDSKAKKRKKEKKPEKQTCEARVAFHMRDPAVDALRGERSQTIELAFPADDLILSTATTARPLDLPPRKVLPDDEIEDEPHTPPMQGPN